MKISLLITSVVLTATQARALPLHTLGCAPTAEAAVARLLSPPASIEASTVGFRVDAVRVDKLHSRAWAMVASCTASARPHLSIALPDGAAVADSTPIIHAGDRVTILSHNGDSHMQLTGWAEEAGTQNQQIRVRLGLALGAGHPTQSIRCSVLKAGVVEVSQ